MCHHILMTKTVDHLSLLTGTTILILMLQTSFGALHHHQGKKEFFNDSELDYIIMVFHVQSNFMII